MKITPVRGAPNRIIGGEPSNPSGGEVPPDCCEDATDADMPDRASFETANMVRLSSGGTPSLVQSKVGSPAGGGGTTTLDDDPTPGNLLVAYLTGRDDHADSPAISTSGWTTIAQVTNTTSFVRNGRMAIKVSDGTDGFIATPGGTSGAYQIVLMEWVGSYAEVFAEADTVAASTDMNSGGSLAATDDSVVIGGATLGFSDGDYPGLSVAPDTDTDEVYDTVNDLNFSPGAWVGYREVATAGTEVAGGTLSASRSYCGVSILVEGSSAAWIIPADNAADGDDATYDTITGTDLLRVDLGAAYRIVRTRIRIAATNAGARTFTIKGANAGDFSDEVTLATIAFTATGSLTAQDVTGLWLTNESYRYFELSIGTSDTYRVHAWELYEETPGSSIVTDPTDGDAAAPLQDVLDNIEDQITAHEADSSDAHDASAISIVDAGAYFTGTDVEAALQELGAGGGGGAAADITFDSDPTHLPLDPDNVQDAIVAAYGPRIFDVPGTGQFIVMAHHGDMNSTDGYPEDTLEAYRQAAERGANWVDLDLRKSSDGVWHCLHDSTLDRTTNMSGAIGSTSAATIAAGHIDGGYGYDAGRHGTSLKVPLLDDVIEALRPYEVVFQFENKAATEATAEELAEYIVANRLVGRAFITASTSGEADAIAAINPNITPQVDAADWNDLDDAADVRAYAPKAVFGVVPVTEFGTTDEGAVVDHLYSIGARGITANDIGAAVAAARAIMAGGSAGGELDDLGDVTITTPAENDTLRYVGGEWINDNRRWEPVTDNPGGGPELVWDGDALVMEWKEY